ncbi:MAG: hypothetical protein WBD20_26035 [Pirellulaceae bacterium]
MTSGRRATLSPSLFPFLAVLVCTLGTLILLLALVAQEAATAATQQAEAKQAEAKQKSAVAVAIIDEEQPPRMSGSEAASLLAEEAFRVDQLVSFRKAQTADMERRRDQLAQVETHMKRLQEELKQLSMQADIATGEKTADAVDGEMLSRLRAKVDEETKLLEQIANDPSKKEPLVALIPHKGPNGTDRRPVYLECTAAGMTIWPEGSTLTAGQLEESVSGANPLDEALKVVRHHVLQNYGDEVPPYPMLVVRPDGIDTYAAARAALQDWDDQFGYELVPADVKLAYGTPDASLKKRVDEAIRVAVVNQHGLNALAQRAQRGYRPSGSIESQKQYPRLSAADMDRRGRSSGYAEHREGVTQSPYSGQSSGYGGTQLNAGTGADIAQTLDRHLREAANELQGSSVNQNPFAGDGSSGQHAGDMNGDSSGTASSKTINPEAGTALAALGESMPGTSQQNRVRPNQFVDPELARDGMLQRQGNPFTMPSGTPWLGSQSSNPALNSATGEPAGDVNGQRSDMAMRSPASEQKPPSKFSMPPTQSPTQSQSAGDPRASAAPQSLSLNQAPNQSHDELARQAEMQQRAAEEAFSRPAADSQSANANNSASREMVSRDGDQWALPRSVAGTRGNSIVRTIRVQCYPSRMVLVASARGGPTEMFGLADDDMDRATLELASAVRDRIERWGAALPGGRWQPRLDVEVMPGGEERYYQLQRLMSGSGVDVAGRHSENSSTGATR